TKPTVPVVLRAPPHHLGQPVEHLSTFVGGQPGPPREGDASRLDCVAHVLTRGSGDVLSLRLVGTPRLGARERARDVELVRLADRKPAHDQSNLRYASSP